MVVRVLGTRYVDFIDEQTRQPVKGTSIYVSYPEKGVNGERYNKCFVPFDKMNIIPDFKFGELYDFEYEYEARGFNQKPKQVLSKITKA